MVIIGGKYIWMYYLVLPLTSPSARKFLPGCVGMCRLCLTGSSWEFWLRHVNICSFIRRAVEMTGLFITGANLRWGGKLHLAESFFIKPEVRERYLPKHDRISKIALEFHWGLRELEFLCLFWRQRTQKWVLEMSWCLVTAPGAWLLCLALQSCSPQPLWGQSCCVIAAGWPWLRSSFSSKAHGVQSQVLPPPQRGALGVPLHFPALTAAQTQLDSSISFFFFPSPALW